MFFFKCMQRVESLALFQNASFPRVFVDEFLVTFCCLISSSLIFFICKFLLAFVSATASNWFLSMFTFGELCLILAFLNRDPLIGNYAMIGFDLILQLILEVLN